MKRLAIILGAALALTSCEKVIQVDYQDGDPKLVIDAEIHMSGQNQVVLTMSQALDNSNPITYVSGATVQIQEPGGTIYTLTEGVTGFYSAPMGVQVPGNYELTMVDGSNTYTATGYMPNPISIDTILQFTQPGFFGGGPSEILELHYEDPLAETNYYRLKVWDAEDRLDDFYYWDDQFFNGETVDFPLFAYDWKTNDTAIVQLISMDEASNEYFEVLAEGQGNGGGFATTPGNPVSNIQGGAIGVFGAYASDTDTVIVQ